jgi:hypothetical protein
MWLNPVSGRAPAERQRPGWRQPRGCIFSMAKRTRIERDERILVVDDQAVNRDVATRPLERP